MDILQTLLSALLSVVALFAVTKAMGHKQLAQLDFFDYVSGITIGSIAAELATELEAPQQPLIALLLYGAVSVLLSLITHKFPKTRKYINGSPTILMSGGRLYRKNMKQAKLDLSEFMILCREQGYFDLADIHTAVFETNGKLTVLPVSTKRPATPADLGLALKPAHIKAEVIMDGRILGENLTRMGVNADWLQRELQARGYRNAKEIYLGLCDENGQLSLYAK